MNLSESIKAKSRYFLIAILLGAAFLRLYGLSRGDTVNDEVLIAFRGLGMMDFDEAEFQTTPREWFDPAVLSGKIDIPAAHEEINRARAAGITAPPWWVHLSFHDHPLLAFLTQSLFLNVFGENSFVFRLPSALLGIVSVFLLYRIVQLLYKSETAALGAALIFAITVNGVYISRTGMQEPYVIFFILLTAYWFLRGLEKRVYLLAAGIALGMGILAKYTAFIIAPAIFLYLIIWRRDLLKEKFLWAGIGAALLIISPIVVYNWELYRTVGHFDFQLSYIFGQHPEVWKVTPGKEIGSLIDRVRVLPARLIATNSWLFLILGVISICGAVISVCKNMRIFFQRHFFVITAGIFTLLLMLVIGPAYRFLTMLTLWLAIAIGLCAAWVIQHWPQRLAWFSYIAAAIITFELFYSWNNQIAYYPVGSRPWLSSKVRYENYNWGYNALGEYMEKELAGKMPALTFDVRYNFLEQRRDAALEEGRQQFLTPYPAMIVTYGNFDHAAKLWALDRLQIYHGWPVISLEEYFQFLNQNGFDYFEGQGFQHYYFIVQTNIALDPVVNQFLKSTNTIPLTIRNPRGEEVFQIYKI